MVTALWALGGCVFIGERNEEARRANFPSASDTATPNPVDDSAPITTPDSTGTLSLCGALGPPPGGGFGTLQLSAGTAHTVTNDPVSGLSIDIFGSTGTQGDGMPTTPGDFVTSGFDHACRTVRDAVSECWGDDSSGQATVPIDGEAEGRFEQIVAGGRSTCGLYQETATCWGEPWTEAVPEGPWRMLTLTLTHGCGVLADGSVACWGEAPDGELPVQPRSLAVGRELVCWVDDGQALGCLGGISGDSRVDDVPAGEYAVVDIGLTSACALTCGGLVRCWGDDGDPVVSDAPRGSWSGLTVGETHACVWTTEGDATCWGDGT